MASLFVCFYTSVSFASVLLGCCLNGDEVEMGVNFLDLAFDRDFLFSGLDRLL